MVNPHNITYVQLGLQIDLRASGQHEDLFSYNMYICKYTHINLYKSFYRPIFLSRGNFRIFVLPKNHD